MNMLRTFHSTTIGESHKAANKVCQDASYCFEDSEKGLFICAISDGHGSNTYFRSDRGSKLLVRIAVDAVQQFVESVNEKLFAVPFMAIPALTTEVQQNINRKESFQDIVFRRLFSSIISNWNEEIKQDWDQDTPSMEDMLMAKVPEPVISRFLEGREIEIAYGCTLIVAVRMPLFWFAFQIGDGKCISFNRNAQWSEPIPWDNRCSGNTTTSICESDALDSFRYCYANSDFPVALFIGSDGMDGAYGDIDEFALPGLVRFYSTVLRFIVSEGYENTIIEIEKSLPILSASGIARDDISLAGIIDIDEIPYIIPLIVTKEIEETLEELKLLIAIYDKKKSLVLTAESEIRQKTEAANMLMTSINELEETLTISKNDLINNNEKLKKIEAEVQRDQENLNILRKGLEKVTKDKENLENKLDVLKSSLREMNPEQVGESEQKIENDIKTIQDSNRDEKGILHRFGTWFSPNKK